MADIPDSIYDIIDKTTQSVQELHKYIKGTPIEEIDRDCALLEVCEISALLQERMSLQNIRDPDHPRVIQTMFNALEWRTEELKQALVKWMRPANFHPGVYSKLAEMFPTVW